VFEMPKKRTVEKAKKDLREGKSPTTAAGEFVREEVEHVRQGSTARARRSRPSPSASPRHAGPGCR
jgi:hypothetical protein